MRRTARRHARPDPRRPACPGDARQQTLHARASGRVELRILEVDVVHDLGDRAQRRVVSPKRSSSVSNVQRSPSCVNSPSNMSKRSSPGSDDSRRPLTNLNRASGSMKRRISQALAMRSTKTPARVTHVRPRYPASDRAGCARLRWTSAAGRSSASAMPTPPRPSRARAPQRNRAPQRPRTASAAGETSSARPRRGAASRRPGPRSGAARASRSARSPRSPRSRAPEACAAS